MLIATSRYGKCGVWVRLFSARVCDWFVLSLSDLIVKLALSVGWQARELEKKLGERLTGLTERTQSLLEPCYTKHLTELHVILKMISEGEREVIT